MLYTGWNLGSLPGEKVLYIGTEDSKLYSMDTFLYLKKISKTAFNYFENTLATPTYYINLLQKIRWRNEGISWNGLRLPIPFL